MNFYVIRKDENVYVPVHKGKRETIKVNGILYKTDYNSFTMNQS